MSDVQNWKHKMFSQTRGESLVYQQSTPPGRLEIWIIIPGDSFCWTRSEIFLRLRDEIFSKCWQDPWHWADRKRSPVSEESPCYWERSWWSQLLLVRPGAAEGRANILNNPTSLSNFLPLWSNVRILARNPIRHRTLADNRHPTVSCQHFISISWWWWWWWCGM